MIYKNVEIDQTKSKSTSDLSNIEIPFRESLKKVKKEVKQSRKTDEKLSSINSTRLSFNNDNTDSDSSNAVINGGTFKYSINHSNDTTRNSDSALKKKANIVPAINPTKPKDKEIVKMFEKLNNQEKEIITKRWKRSSEKKSNNVGLDKQVPSNRFYRHPKLSYEEQQQFNDKLAKDMTLNFGNVLSKGVLDVFNRPHPKLEIEPLSKQFSKYNYVPVFPKCNDADNSEVTDLNKPVLVHSENGNKNGRNDDDNSSWPQKFEDFKDNEALLKQKSESSIEQPESLKESQVSSDQDRSTVSTVKGQTDKTYINIQEHQRQVEETTSSDIPVYDPEKIPYVDVPDYSDIIEESLDDEDHREHKKDVKQKDVEFIDVDARDRKKVSSSSKINESKGNRKKTSKGSQKSSLSRKNLKEQELKATLKKDEGRESQKGSGETQRRDNSAVELESMIFDINEYRKPFNLDEFLKDDPIMKKLELLGKETRTIYGENRKRVPGCFNVSESDNASTERTGKQEDSGDERDGFDYPSKSRSSDLANAFAEMIESDRAKINGEYNRNEETKEDLNFGKHDRDEDLTRSVARNNKKDDNPSGFNKEKELLSRYFTEDVGNPQKNANGEGYRERKDARRKEDMHDALSAILDKKIRASRLNEDTGTRIKAGDNPALVYKNFWSLEYDSPRKKADMVAQEKRK